MLQKENSYAFNVAKMDDCIVLQINSRKGVKSKTQDDLNNVVIYCVPHCFFQVASQIAEVNQEETRTLSGDGLLWKPQFIGTVTTQ